MATFDRSKFKATSTAVIAQQEEVAEEFSNRGSGKGRPGYLPIPEGTTKYRIYPAHPDCDSCFIQKSVHWLPQEVEEKDAKGKVSKVMRRKPTFNARVHGNYSRDIVEEYIALARRKVAEEIQDEDYRKNVIGILTHFETGVSVKTNWICYAKMYKKDNTTDFGRLEMSVSLKDRLNDLSVTEEANDPISVDPFSDPETGKAILVTYDKEAQPKDKYKAALEWRNNYRLEDDELEAFMEVDTLESMFQNVYKRSDFENAVTGIENFDQIEYTLPDKKTKYTFNLCQTDEWNQLLNEISELVPEDKAEEEGEKKEEVKKENNKATGSASISSGKKAETKKEVSKDVVEDEFTEMGREELKAFNKEMNLGITFLKKHTEDDMRSLIREAMDQEDDLEPEEVVTEKEEVKEEKKSTSKVSAFRDKLKGKKS